MRVNMRSGVKRLRCSSGHDQSAMGFVRTVSRLLWIQLRGRVGSLQDTCYNTQRRLGRFSLNEN